MDVREKLVEMIDYAKQIATAKCNGYVLCNNCPNKKYEGRCKDIFMVEELIANGVTVQGWKPISEPPKEKGTYLVCTDNGGVLLGHWYGTAWNAGGGAKKHLAYWMEKPQPPKGE